jgi:bacillithiol biosynthesis cysteine-adding enzyme BshC
MPPNFYSSYVGTGMLAHDFYPRGFGTRADRVAQTRAAAARAVTPQLMDRLRAQNANLPPSPARERNLEALAEHGAAVITGQQVGLFLGPLYTLYKAATAVAVARLLEAEAGVRCVPIFWLQTEDHDFAEIASCRIPRLDGVLARLEVTAEAALHARASVAQRTLPPEIATVLGAVDETLAELPHGAAVSALLREHYCAGTTWPRAFAGVLAQLFADEGLIVFDPREEAVARLTAPLMRKALVEHEAIERALATRATALAAAGLTEQVRARPGMPLPFFHVDDRRGPRQRLRCHGESFAVEGCTLQLSQAQLLELLEADPLRFSTSALLRPLVQDSLLPTAAYVGGPAEVNYFAQLAPLYPLFDLPLPLLAPRARFRLVPSALRKLLDKLGLQPADVEQPREQLALRLPVAPGASDGEAAPSRAWIGELEARLDGLAARAPALDPQLVRAVERTRATVLRALGRLERRHARAQLERDATAAGRLDRLQRWLFPEGEPQERVHSLLHYAASVGPQPLVAAVLNALDPLHPQTRDLEL